MSTTTLSNTNTHASSQFFDWCKLSFKLLRKAPVTIYALSIATMVFAGIFQILPAPYGVIISKIVGAMLVPLLWIVLHQVDQYSRFKFSSFKQYSGYRKLPLLGLVMLLPNITQMIVAVIVLGDSGIDLVLFGVISNVSKIQIAIILASAAPVFIIFMFAPAFMLFKHQSVISAAKSSIDTVVQVLPMMLAILALNAVVLFLAPFTFALSGLMLGPWLACLTYVAFKQLCL